MQFKGLDIVHRGRGLVAMLRVDELGGRQGINFKETLAPKNERRAMPNYPPTPQAPSGNPSKELEHSRLMKSLKVMVLAKMKMNLVCTRKTVGAQSYSSFYM
ncbi:unnamed protein product [Prunus armeniaca]